LPSHTRGGSRMRESRTYGSVRGARDETRVPTASRSFGHAPCCTSSGLQLAHRCKNVRSITSGAGKSWRSSDRHPPGEPDWVDAAPNGERKHIGAGVALLSPSATQWPHQPARAAWEAHRARGPSWFSGWSPVRSGSALVQGGWRSRQWYAATARARFFLEGLGLCHETRCLVPTIPSPLQQPSLRRLRVCWCSVPLI